MVADPVKAQSPYKFSIKSLRKRAQELCQLKSVTEIAKQLNPKAEFEKAVTACFGYAKLEKRKTVIDFYTLQSFE